MHIDGVPGDSVTAADRGLHYGDGLFETLAVAGGEPLLWDAHVARLVRGCRRLGIPAPDPAKLLGECRREIGNRRRCVLKILLTRGPGGRGYRPPDAPSPTRVVAVHPVPDWPAAWWHHGVRLHLCRTRLAEQPALAGLKHLNRLEQVLARSEWSDPDVPEGLMCDTAGRVVEGTMSNLFLIRSGRLYTPALERCGVAGVMRATVMAAAAARGEPVQACDLDPAELQRADGLFLSNALIGVWPVRSLEGRAFDPAAVPDWLGRAVMPLALGPEA